MQPPSERIVNHRFSALQPPGTVPLSCCLRCCRPKAAVTGSVQLKPPPVLLNAGFGPCGTVPKEKEGQHKECGELVCRRAAYRAPSGTPCTACLLACWRARSMVVGNVPG